MNFPIIDLIIYNKNLIFIIISDCFKDTVVALGALAKFAAKIIVPNTDIAVSFTYGKDVTKEFKINSANSIILQKQEVSICSSPSDLL